MKTMQELYREERDEAQEECITLRAQRDALLEAAEAALPHMKQNIADIGGCDHSVGICCCDLIQATDNLRAAIEKAKP